MNLCRSFYLHKTSRNRHIFNELARLSEHGARLYNQMVFYWRQWRAFYGYTPSAFDFMYMLRNAEPPYDHYAQFQAAVSSKACNYSIQMFHGSFASYDKSIKRYYKDKSGYTGMPKPPSWCTKARYYFASGGVVIKDRMMYLAKRKHPELCIPIPKDQWEEAFLKNGKLKQARFYYLTKKTMKVEMIYEQEATEAEGTGVLGIDLGVNNFATLVSNRCPPVILNGKPIKAINQYYNKRRAKIVSKLKKANDQDDSFHMRAITLKRRTQLHTIMHKYSTYIISLCREHGIIEVIMGRNQGWKQNIEMGARGNQRFVGIPFFKFQAMLKYKCELNGIAYSEVEESYTSKTDHLAREPLYSKNGKESKPEAYQFLGQRVHRGLFQSSTGVLINADVNGAIGIIRKVKGDDIVQEMVDIFNPRKVTLNDLDR